MRVYRSRLIPTLLRVRKVQLLKEDAPHACNSFVVSALLIEGLVQRLLLPSSLLCACGQWVFGWEGGGGPFTACEAAKRSPHAALSFHLAHHDLIW